MQIREAVLGFIAAAALGISGWSLVTVVSLTNAVTGLSATKADKERVYQLDKTQAVLAEAMKNQTIILGRLERKMDELGGKPNG